MEEELEVLRGENELLTKNNEEMKNTIDKLQGEISALKAAHCVRCGRAGFTEALKCDEKIVKEYFRAMLGQRPFSHTYKCYDGLLELTFTELYGADLEKERELVSSAKNADSFAEQVADFLLVTTLRKICVVDPESQAAETLYEVPDSEVSKLVADPLSAMRQLSSKVTHSQMAVLRSVSQSFSLLLAVLIDKGLDKGFYEGAGLL